VASASDAARNSAAAPQRGLHPLGAVGVAAFHHPDQPAGRPGEPVLQVAAGPADLPFG